MPRKNFSSLLAGLKAFFPKSTRTINPNDSHLRRIYESNMIGFALSDNSGKVLDANEYYLDLLGVSRKQVQAGQVNWHNFTDPMSQEKSMEAVRELQQVGRTQPFEKVYIRSDGQRVTVLVGAAKIDSETNIGYILDLSKSKLGERLSQSEQFLESVIEFIPNMIFVKDAKDLKFVRFNRAGEELVGHPRTAMIGKSDYDFFPKEQADYFIAADREVLKHHAVVDIPEEPIATTHGTRYLHTKKIPLFDKDGIPQYLIGISEDITEKKIAEQQKIALLQEQAARMEAEKSADRMALLTDQANEANRAKSAFLANISHELRTPLGAMIGFAELALEAENADKNSEYVKTVLRNGKELLRIVDEVLDISKAESNSMEIEIIKFSLSNFIKDINDLMIVRAQQKDLQLKFDTKGSLPEFVVSDPFRLRQILLNVIGNAIKFTEKGSVTVETSKTGDELKFEVTDTGIGIDPVNAERLFRPFTQADDTTTRKFGGTGLGLFLSRRLAGLLGGNVQIYKSSAGNGSCFVITVKEKLELPDNATKKVDAMAVQAKTLKGGYEKFKVMIVDDAADNQELIAAYLDAQKIKYARASRGGEAVDLADESFHVILMDIQMPEMDGFEALKRLREKGIETPVVAVTAHAMKGDRERCVEAGFDDYLSKPISRKALYECLDRFFETLT